MAIFNTVYGGEPKWKPGANTFGYYTFDDQNSSQITDSSGNNRNLTGNTMPTYSLVSGTNYAGNYAGTTGAAPTLSYSTIGSNYTLLIWVKPTANTQSYISEIIVGGHQSSLIWSYNSGQFEYFTDQTGTRKTIKSGASLDTWYLIGYTVNGTSVQTYCNGVASETSTYPSGSNGSFYLGSSPGGDRLKGMIGECVVENITRTAQDVSDYYNKTKSKYGL